MVPPDTPLDPRLMQLGKLIARSREEMLWAALSFADLPDRWRRAEAHPHADSEQSYEARRRHNIPPVVPPAAAFDHVRLLGRRLLLAWNTWFFFIIVMDRLAKAWRVSPALNRNDGRASLEGVIHGRTQRPAIWGQSYTDPPED